MKLNKTFGRIATTLVATAMLASVAVVPAFAVDNNSGVMEGSQSEAVTEIKFDKQLLLPENVDVPTVNFTFTMAAAEPTKDSDSGVVTETVPGNDGDAIKVRPGVMNGTVNPVTVNFTKDDTKRPLDAGDIDTDGVADGQEDSTAAALNIKKAVEPVSINIGNLTFADAGVYKYTISETDNSDDANIVNGSDHTLYLYVERKDGTQDQYVVTGAVLEDENGNKTDVYNNSYMLGGDPDDPIDPDNPPVVTPNELTLTKTVTGAMGDYSENFKFSVTVGSVSSNKTYTAKYTDNEGNAIPGKADVSLTAGEPAEITLAHNQQLHIYGVGSGETYTIAEHDYTSEGYDAPTVSGDVNADNTQGTFDATEDPENVNYTNNREAVSPTGLIMDIAPYALLVVVAAAGCFVFLHKRRED